MEVKKECKIKKIFPDDAVTDCYPAIFTIHSSPYSLTNISEYLLTMA